MTTINWQDRVYKLVPVPPSEGFFSCHLCAFMDEECAEIDPKMLCFERSENGEPQIFTEYK